MTQRRLQKSLHICMILMMISGLMGALPVRANGPNGPSLWSDLRSFQVE